MPSLVSLYYDNSHACMNVDVYAFFLIAAPSTTTTTRVKELLAGQQCMHTIDQLLVTIIIMLEKRPYDVHAVCQY